MNKHKGEVALEADGATYKLQFSIDALCALEASTGMVLSDFLEAISVKGKMSVAALRHMLHASLATHHPEIDLKTAGELIMHGGGVMVATTKIFEAIAAAFPEAAAQAEASGTPRPPQPAPANRKARRAAGTGRGSGKPGSR